MQFVTKLLICLSLLGLAGLSISSNSGSDEVPPEVASETRYVVNEESELSSEPMMEAETVVTSESEIVVDESIVEIGKETATPPVSSPTIVEEELTAEEDIAYTEDELYLLSHLIQAEAGSDCISNEHQQLVGAVAMNRVADERFPDTLYNVIYQSGQYSCVNSGTFYLDPTDRAVENAIAVLNGEVECPDDLVFQAEFAQGYAVWKTFHTPFSRTYFCLG